MSELVLLELGAELRAASCGIGRVTPTDAAVIGRRDTDLTIGDRCRFTTLNANKPKPWE